MKKLFVLLFALLACRSTSSAPEANPEIASAQGQQAGSASAPSGGGKPAKAKPDLKDRPVIDGFEKMMFGDKFAALNKSVKVRKRCTTRPLDAKTDKTFPDQSFQEKWIFCDATLTDRFAKLTLYFDQNEELYRVAFSFENSFGFDSKVKELLGEEKEKFVSDLRGVLEPKHGKAIDTSSDGLGGKSLNLQWIGRTEDASPHEAEINVDFSGAILTTQTVEWIDKTRQEAMKAQIEKERTESIKKKGL